MPKNHSTLNTTNKAQPLLGGMGWGRPRGGIKIGNVEHPLAYFGGCTYVFDSRHPWQSGLASRPPIELTLTPKWIMIASVSECLGLDLRDRSFWSRYLQQIEPTEAKCYFGLWNTPSSSSLLGFPLYVGELTQIPLQNNGLMASASLAYFVNRRRRVTKQALTEL